MKKTTELNPLFSEVHCPGCREALESCEQNEHHFPLAAKRYRVGNIAKVELGHQMYFSDTGRIALCIAKIR